MRKLWADLASARRKLIASRALEDDPFLSRLWHHHLFWIWSFARTEAIVEPRAIVWGAYRGYCRMADRLLGGNREENFRELLRKRAERCEAKAREVEAQREARHRIHEQFNCGHRAAAEGTRRRNARAHARDLRHPRSQDLQLKTRAS